MERVKVKRAVFYFFGIIIIIIFMILSYKYYIHKKHFNVEMVQTQYIKDSLSYNSNYYGFVEGSYYELNRFNEIIRISSDGTAHPFSEEGNIVFNHKGQLFVRNLDEVYEVTNSSLNYLFEADTLHSAERIGDVVYYVTYRYNESYSKSYYELMEYNTKKNENKLISKILVNGFPSIFDDGYDFLIEDDWLVFADAQDVRGRIGLYNIKTNEIIRIIDYESYPEGFVEDINLIDGKIYFRIVDYSDLPSYGVDDISSNSDGYGYCYEIKSNKVYKGSLDLEIIYKDELDLKDQYQLDYVKHLSDEELDNLFEYIEDPKLIEPEGDVYEYETHKEGLFYFDIDKNEVEVYYSFNQPNVMKYGQLYQEPFSIPIPERGFVTNIYYISIDKKTGKSSRLMNNNYTTY